MANVTRKKLLLSLNSGCQLVTQIKAVQLQFLLDLPKALRGLPLDANLAILTMPTHSCITMGETLLQFAFKLRLRGAEPKTSE